ncbi:MAG: alpha/beta hydrolase [Acidobacteriota bacterium]|nr:MAG: alpha/beta hydrolase [Acidobacteriota bacterium]
MRVRTVAPVFLVILALVSCTGPDKVPGPAEAPALENGSFSAVLNGFRIHYEIHGNGPVLMVLPNSWGITVGGLRELYRPLEERLTVTYFEPRGMGASDPIKTDSDMGLEAVRSDFQALRRFLGQERVHAIGWSNGAVNLIELASEYPETLSTAIFLHGTARNTAEDDEYFARQQPQLVEAYQRFLQQMEDPALSDSEKDESLKRLWLEEFFPISCADRESASRIIESLFGHSEFSWRHAFYSQKETQSFDFRDRLERISVPSLVLAGRYDLITVSRSEEIAEGIPNSRFVVFEASGHFAPAEERERFKTVVFEFLDLTQ